MPFDSRDQLAELLTDDDVAMLKHLASEGMGDNTMWAQASALAYLEVFCRHRVAVSRAAPGNPLLKFVVHHLWYPAEHGNNSDHVMPEGVTIARLVKTLLRSAEPHALGTARRRLTS